nr:acetyl-CoA carboxylase biotin carboxyl carrier protein subunit [Motiliproteus sp. SC1-56]
MIEVRASSFPECWETCGTCATDELRVVERCVAPGARVALYDCLLVLEATKIELEVNAPCAGTVDTLLVEEGDEILPDEVLLLLLKD